MKQYDWEKIKTEYTTGKSLSAISREYDCNRATIRKRVKHEGWQRPDPLDIHMPGVLIKATHEDLLKFSPIYKKCHEKRIEYLNYCQSTKPKYEALKTQVSKAKALADQTRKANSKRISQKRLKSKKTPFLSTCLNKIIGVF